MEKKYLTFIILGTTLILISLCYLFFANNNNTPLSQKNIQSTIKKSFGSVNKTPPTVTPAKTTSNPSTSPSQVITGTANPRVTLVTGEIIPESVKKQAQNINYQSTYEHPQLHYTVKYPSSWKAETATEPYAEYEGYLDAKIYPFGNQTRISQYQSTPEVIIRVEDTDKNIDEFFETDPLGKQHAEKIQNTTIHSNKAFIYDWSFDSTVSQTAALFIEDGKAYKIQMTWTSDDQKKLNLDEFVSIYQSFSN